MGSGDPDDAWLVLAIRSPAIRITARNRVAPIETSGRPAPDHGKTIMLIDAPTLILGLTVTAYWTYVARMVKRVRSETVRVEKVLIPAQRREKIMWLIWVPVIGGWFCTPLKVAFGFIGPFDHVLLPQSVAESGTMLVIRYAFTALALGCLALSIKTWRHMGEQWRMGIDPSQKIKLLVDGPFARVRHPIYSLSILLMLCSVVVLPSPIMFGLAAVHITLMHIKARNEERFLLESQGAAYADYCRRTSRFFPFGRSRVPSHIPIMSGTETSPDRPIRGWKEGGQYPFRLNLFQQAMLKWDTLHPYNAVHVVRVRGRADVAALREAVWDICKEAELGEFARNALGTAYEYRPLQAVHVMEVVPGQDDEQRLDEVLSEEINAGFHGHMHHPVRWTVFNEHDGNAHYVILCYHHAISDAYGIERLLAAVLRRYLNLPANDGDAGLTTRLTDLRRSLSLKTGPFDRLAAHVRLLVKHRQTRSSHRMADERFGGDYTWVVSRAAPDGLFERLSAGCQRRGVGVNDALLAAFVSAIAEQTPDRRTDRRRRRLTMATVFSARKHLPPEQAHDFGVCLSSIVVVLRNPDDSMEDLVRAANRETRGLKAHPRWAAAETAMRFFGVRWAWWMATVKYTRRQFRRVFPICGGLSTVRVDSERFADLREHVTRYIRACPAGPAMPLLLGPTIMNGQLELGLTYRLASRTREQAEAMLDLILARLEQLADPVGAESTAAESLKNEHQPASADASR